VPVVMGIAHLLWVLQVPPSSPTARVVAAMMAGPSSSGSGGAEPLSKKATLGLSCRCPHGMCKVCSIGLYCSYFSYSCSDFKRWCWGDRSCTLSVLIVRRPVECPATSPYLPLMSLLAASLGDLAMVPSALCGR
jgi:hypothetical protein